MVTGRVPERRRTSTYVTTTSESCSTALTPAAASASNRPSRAAVLPAQCLRLKAYRDGHGSGHRDARFEGAIRRARGGRCRRPRRGRGGRFWILRFEGRRPDEAEPEGPWRTRLYSSQGKGS